MFSLEILTLSFLLITILLFFFHKNRNFFLVFLLLTIGFAVSQYFLEGFRWQFLPCVYLLPTTYIIHRYQTEKIKLIFKVFISVWFVFAIIIPYIIPVFSLPIPNGKYTIGTETFHWVDSSRLEWFTNENPNDYREIMVQIWYPGINNLNKKVEPYMDFINLRAKTIAAAGGLPSFLPSHLNMVKTNSHKGITCINENTNLPVIIFSHGITGSRHLHQALFEHLSSQGYVVAALDHSYDSNLTVFPDKRIADYRSEITGHPDSINIRNQQINTRGLDISFVLDQLEKIQSGIIVSNLTNKLNLKNIAIGGHSYGGATAIVSTQKDNRIKACFILDGWISPIPDSIITTGLKTPIFSIGRPHWKDSDYPNNYHHLKDLISNSKGSSYNIVIQNTLHLDYTDIPLYSPIIKHVMDVGSLAPEISQPLINNLILDFLDSYLLNKPKKNLKNNLNNKLVSNL